VRVANILQISTVTLVMFVKYHTVTGRTLRAFKGARYLMILVTVVLTFYGTYRPEKLNIKEIVWLM